MYLKVETTDAANKLSDLLKDGDWMVLYYAEWCGHCTAMKPEWEKVVEKLKGNGNINIADIKSDVIGALSHKPKIEGFPTIKMYNKGNEVANFEDKRFADKIEKFALSNATNNNKKIAVKNAINTVLQKFANKDAGKITNTINLEAPSPSPIVVGDNSNEVRKLNISQLKDEILSSHNKSNNNVIEIKNENNQVKTTRVSKQQDANTNMIDLDMLLQPPVPSRKASHKPTRKASKKPIFKTQINANNRRKNKVPVNTDVPLACSDIRKAQLCKTNPKCFFDYIEFKCKNKSERPAPKWSKRNKKTIQKGNPQKQSQMHPQKQSQMHPQKQSQMHNKDIGTKAILRELQKSFKKISNEASKDSNLLAKASNSI